MSSDFGQHRQLISGVDSNWRTIHSRSWPSFVTFHTIFMCTYSTASKENVVYCDGSCLGNGQKGAVAGIGVYWSPDNK